MPALKTILRMNAASCLCFGALFMAAPGPVAAFLGVPPAPDTLILLLGAVLALNGLHLLHTSFRPELPRLLVLYFSAGDFLWVAITAALIATNLWITTAAGIAVAIVVALAVGGMGLAQLHTSARPAPQRGSTTQ